jgi:hydrogenase maturation protease
MTPDSVFALVRTLGGAPRNVTIVGCEPLTFGPENEGSMELSEPVADAVGEAVTIVERLLSRLVPSGSAS